MLPSAHISPIVSSARAGGKKRCIAADLIRLLKSYYYKKDI